MPGLLETRAQAAGTAGHGKRLSVLLGAADRRVGRDVLAASDADRHRQEVWQGGRRRVLRAVRHCERIAER